MALEIQFTGDEYNPVEQLEKRNRELINAVSRLKVIIEAINMPENTRKLVDMLVEETNLKYHV